jgi:hypothetical protein
MSNANFTNFNWDASTNMLDISYNEFMNIFPLPPRNISMNFNPFLSTTNNAFDNLITNTLLEKNPYIKVTTEKAINDIKKIIYNKDIEQKECPITMMDFEEGEEISKLSCGHIFNTEAINRWLKDEDYKCPVCRHELEYKEIKKYDLSSNDLSSNDLSSNDLVSLGNHLEMNFESFLINMIQTQVRRNYRDSHFDSMINDITTNLDNEYDNELQQAIWDSINLED